MRLFLCVVATFMLQGCIRSTVYVEPALTPVPLVPRPLLTNDDLVQDRQHLMRAFRAQEQTVLEYNQMIYDWNTERGYPTDPDSLKPTVIDYSTLD